MHGRKLVLGLRKLRGMCYCGLLQHYVATFSGIDSIVSNDDHVHVIDGAPCSNAIRWILCNHISLLLLASHQSNILFRQNYSLQQILSYFQKSLNFNTFKSSLLGATKTSCMIAFILAGSTFLSLAMGFTGLPRNLAIWIQSMDLSPYTLLFVLTVFYIILGMFLDGISAVVLTMAIIEPMIRQAGFDMIWFGIFLVIVVEMAQITPPVGFNLFVLQGMAKKDMGYIARSAFPLFLLMVLAVILVVIFPEIALWMPEQMIKNIN